MKYELMNLELADNPTTRVPICLCLDASSSMDGAPIDELNNCTLMFFDAIKEDEVALYSADIAIITFSNDDARCIREFAGINNESDIPTIIANGGTPMGEAVNLSLDMLEERKKEYRQNGVDYYQPWLVLMSDGAPNGDPNELDRAIKRVNDLVASKKLVVFAIGVGEYADMDVLAKFSPNRRPLRLQGLKFREFFVWLSQSVVAVSQSTPGESVKLPTNLDDWAEL